MNFYVVSVMKLYKWIPDLFIKSALQKDMFLVCQVCFILTQTQAGIPATEGYTRWKRILVIWGWSDKNLPLCAPEMDHSSSSSKSIRKSVKFSDSSTASSKVMESFFFGLPYNIYTYMHSRFLSNSKRWSAYQWCKLSITVLLPWIS